MDDKPKFLLVDSKVLPDVFYKVVYAKRLLAKGKARSSSEAAKMADISRSAFYKYREAVMPFQDMRSSRILTFQILLHDEPGSLNKLLSTFTNHQANIMTINSIVPTNGSAVVTIAAETVNLEIPLEDLLEEFRQVPGVIKADVLAG